MALFKPLNGKAESLASQALHEGYAYFCYDDGTFHIDFVDDEGNLRRKQLAATAVDVPAWAKATTKPTYTADEIEGVSKGHFIVNLSHSIDEGPDGSTIYNYSVDKTFAETLAAFNEGREILLRDGGSLYSLRTCSEDLIFFDYFNGATYVDVALYPDDTVEVLRARTTPLPEVSAADNGKFLKVEGGEWVASTVARAEDNEY